MGTLRYRVVMKYIGGVLLVLTAEFLLVAAAALVLGEWRRAPHYLAIGLVLAALGWSLVRQVPEKEITGPEAMAVAALSYLAASLAGAAPFLLFGSMGVVDAWFDSMSGFTTTGFSLLDVAAAPRSLLLFRALSQWLGGMGFVLFTVSLLIWSARVSSRAAATLLKDDALEARYIPRIESHVKVIVATYAVLTVIGVAVLSLAGVGPFDALCLTLSGVSTGGFATRPDSVAALGGGAAPLLGLVFIMWMGAVNFLIYYRLWLVGRGIRGVLSGLLGNPQLKCLMLLTVLGCAAMYLHPGWEGGPVQAFFLVASAVTTTGYSAGDVSMLPAFPMMLLVPLMFIGGSVGSSAGGIKLFRLIYLLKGVRDSVLSSLYPKEVVRRKGVEKDELVDILVVITFYAATVAAGSVVLVGCGYEPLASIFEVTSAVSTVGLSSGIVSTGLSGWLKALMTLLMWAGRVEFIPIVVWSYSLASRAR